MRLRPKAVIAATAVAVTAAFAAAPASAQDPPPTPPCMEKPTLTCIALWDPQLMEWAIETARDLLCPTCDRSARR